MVLVQEECMKLFNINVWNCSDFLNKDFYFFYQMYSFYTRKWITCFMFNIVLVYKIFYEAIFIWIIKNYNGKIVIVRLYCVVNLLLRQYLMCHFYWNFCHKYVNIPLELPKSIEGFIYMKIAEMIFKNWIMLTK